MDIGRPVDKYLVGDFFPNIVIYNTLSICSRMVGWGTQDPRLVLELHRLVGFRVVLIQWAVLGRFMRQARGWACAGTRLT